MRRHEENIPELLAARRRKITLVRDFFALAVRMLMAAAVGWLLLTRVFLLTQAEGNGMYPALEDGDLMVGYRLTGKYEKNDTVLYIADGSLQAGRIVAEEDDLVSFDDSGILRINGRIRSEHAFFLSEGKNCLRYPYRVEEGCVFILGDHRTCCRDSRDFGPIPVNQLEAKVITVVRRRSI